jgi:voltage-gated potassium channel
MKKKDSFAKLLLNSTDTIKELVAIYLSVILVCSLAFVYFEAIAFKDAVWMSFVTATSTGYGDFFPKTMGGRVVGVFLMHSVILVVAPMMVYRIIDAIDHNDFTHAEQEEQKRKQDWIIAQLESQTGQKYAPENAS